MAFKTTISLITLFCQVFQDYAILAKKLRAILFVFKNNSELKSVVQSAV